MTAKEQVTSIYCAVMEHDGEEAARQLNNLLLYADESELKKLGCDLYMLFRFCASSELFSAETIDRIVNMMDRLALYVVSVGNGQHLVDIRNNDNLDVGIFVGSFEKLTEPVVRIERLYVTNGYHHFTEIIYRDANGLKFRQIELPPPPEKVVPGYELTNGMLMEREENLKLMFDDEEKEA